MSYVNFNKSGPSILRLNSAVQSPKLRMSGHYTVRKINAETKQVVQELQFDNAITNIGLDRLGANGTAAGHVMGNCYIGTGTAVPAITDTQMSVYGATSTSKLGQTNQSDVGVDHYCYCAITHQFTPGTATGTWTEVGVGWSSSPTTNYLWSRQLFLDGTGSPVAVTVLSMEYLEITYEVRLYPYLTELSGTLALAGGGTYGYKMRARPVSYWTVFANYGGAVMNVNVVSVLGSTAAGATASFPVSLTAQAPTVSAGSLQQANLPSSSIGTYTPGTFKNTSTSGTLPTTGGNFASGILAAYFYNQDGGGISVYNLIIFDTPIPKTSANTVNFTAEISWSRY